MIDGPVEYRTFADPASAVATFKRQRDAGAQACLQQCFAMADLNAAVVGMDAHPVLVSGVALATRG